MFIWTFFVLVMSVTKHFFSHYLEVDAVQLLESPQNVSNLEVEIGKLEEMLPGN